MGSRRSIPNIRRSSITRTQWDKMLAAYRERPTIQSVMAAGAGKRIARRAIMEGWPDLSLPPFIELLSSGTSVHKEMAVMRETWQEAAVTQGEATRLAAEEAMAARVSMSAALQASRLAQGYASMLLKKLENGELSLPEEITPKVMQQIVMALDRSAAVVERAVRIERLRTGEPEATLGSSIIVLINQCKEDELESVIATGTVPSRLLDQRRRVIDAVSESAAEEKALIEIEPEDAEDEDVDIAGELLAAGLVI